VATRPRKSKAPPQKALEFEVETSPDAFYGYADSAMMSSNDPFTSELIFVNSRTRLKSQTFQVVEGDGGERPQLQAGAATGGLHVVDIGHVRMRRDTAVGVAEIILRHLGENRLLGVDDLDELVARIRAYYVKR